MVVPEMAEAYKRRRKGDLFRDVRMLPNDFDEPIVFFGGKDYVPLFCKLTKDAKGKRTVFYNAGRAPEAPGFHLKGSSHRPAPTGIMNARESLPRAKSAEPFRIKTGKPHSIAPGLKWL
jgi:hypothetical protein